MFDLSKKEITWRRTWLIFLGLFLVYDFFRPFFIPYYPLNYFAGFAFSLLGSGILYYCAYKKPGTRLLLLSLVLAPFSLAAKVWTVAIYFSGFAAIGCVLVLLWAFLCFELRKINRKLQAAKKAVVIEVKT